MAIQYGSPSRPVGRAPLARPVSQTLAQVANQRVNARLQPQLAAQNTFNTGQNAQIRSFANALLGKLQPIAGQVGADYNSAIQQTGALSNQAAKYLSAANPTGQVANLLSSVNAPPEQQAQLAGQLGQTFGGGAGVLAFTQGTVPGSQLATDKAAAQSQARSYPLIAALKGQQDLASALGAQSQARQTLEATRPALYQAAAQDITQNNLARQKLAQGAAAQTEKVREFGITQGDKVAAAKATADYKDKALAATKVYRQGLLKQSQGRIDLGYAKVKQTAKDKAADRAATKTYHASYLAHLTAGDNEKVAHDKAMEAAAQERNHIAQQRANKPSSSGEFTIGNTRYNADGTVLVKGTGSAGGPFTIGNTRYRADGTPLVTGKSSSSSKPATVDVTQSRLRGVWVDHSGNPIPSLQGPGIKKPAATLGGSGTASKPKTLSAQGLQGDTSRINLGVDNMVSGKNSDGTAGKKYGRDGAIAMLHDEGYFATPQLAKIAMAAINRAYGPGSPVYKAKSKGGVQGVTSP